MELNKLKNDSSRSVPLVRHQEVLGELQAAQERLEEREVVASQLREQI